MDDQDSPGAESGLPPVTRRPTEIVLQHWPAPGGRGLLTSERCLLLGHPHPLHREIEWELDLDKIGRLEVVALADDPEVVAFVQRTLAGGSKTGDPTAGVINCEYKIVVDETTVHVGDAAKCGSIQGWIDDARARRCMALYGRVLPYRP